MRKFSKQISLICGLILTLAAFPVFAQEKSTGEIEINTKPLRDLADLVISKLQKNEITLSQPFLIEISGELTKDGKFDRQKTRYIRAQGNEQMSDVAKIAIEAVNDTGIFIYLRDLEIERFSLIFAQNNEQVYAIMKSGLVSEVKAKEITSVLNMVFSMGKMVTKDEDEKTLLSGMAVSYENKSLILKFAVNKPVVQEIIQRKLTEEISKRLVKESSSQK